MLAAIESRAYHQVARGESHRPGWFRKPVSATCMAKRAAKATVIAPDTGPITG